MLSIDNFSKMNCHYKKYYMVESERNIGILTDYRKSIVAYSFFPNRSKGNKK